MYSSDQLEKMIFEEGLFNLHSSIQLVQSDTVGWVETQLDSRLIQYSNVLRLILGSSEGATMLSDMLDGLDEIIDKFKSEDMLPIATTTSTFVIGDKKIELTLLQLDFSRFIRQIIVTTLYQ